MKVTREDSFRPVSIHLETEDELGVLIDVLNNSDDLFEEGSPGYRIIVNLAEELDALD